MPRLSDTMTEGTLLRWKVRPGDRVTRGQPLAEVETDKATVDVESPDAGTVTALSVEEGATAEVGQLLCMLGGDGEPLAPPPPPPAVPAVAADPDSSREPLTPIRARMTRRLLHTINVPTFAVSMTAGVDHLVATREPGTTITDHVLLASARALRAHPRINASFDGDALILHQRVHLGLVIDLDGGGLVVATLRDADRLALAEIAARRRDLVGRARSPAGLAPADMADATFTISNLGGHGVDDFTPIIHEPAAAILGVGAAQERPVVRAGRLVAGHEMRLTLVCDHRVIDGAAAARFLATVRQELQGPAT